MIKQKLLKKNKQNKQLQNFILHKQKNIITNFKNIN
jgi:ribosomal protein L39E